MKIYTKQGDGGETSLANGERVPKYDERIELLGRLDELSSRIGLAKVCCGAELREKLSAIQRDLIQMMAEIAEAGEQPCGIRQERIISLEEDIDRMESAIVRKKEFVLYGGCEQSARLDDVRALARSAERCFCRTALHHSLEPLSQQYLNRLSDYLYMAARFADSGAADGNESEKDKSEE